MPPVSLQCVHFLGEQDLGCRADPGFLETLAAGLPQGSRRHPDGQGSEGLHAPAHTNA